MLNFKHHHQWRVLILLVTGFAVFGTGHFTLPPTLERFAGEIEKATAILTEATN